MTSKNDLIYIHKVLNGDVNSFSYLVDNYKDMVFTLALKMTKNREEAEEISQDTFIKAYKSLAKFKGDSKFSTWLYKITYHACLDALKRNKIKHQTIEINEITSSQITSADNILQTINRKDRARMIQKCLSMLSENERSVLWLFYFKELSLKEITEVTSLSETNLKVKLHRARKKLLAVVKNTVEPEFISHYGKK